MVYSAFGGGRLLDFLTGPHVDTLIVSGGETDVCVLSTVLSAIDLGYRIILVQDALCSSSDESHDAILGLYCQRFDIQVGVAGLEQILGYGSPNKKAELASYFASRTLVTRFRIAFPSREDLRSLGIAMNANSSLQWRCNCCGLAELVFENVVFKHPRCSAVAVANWLGTCHTGASGSW